MASGRSLRRVIRHSWGNFLHFEAAPGPEDAERWPSLFESHVRTSQLSRHTAFSWEGYERGASDSFVRRGYHFLESVIMEAHQLTPAGAVAIEVDMRRIDGDIDWEKLVEFHMHTRDPIHSEADHQLYMRRKAAQWRKSAETGLSLIVGAFVGNELAAALGLYAESKPGPDGRRCARYQDVVTDPRWRQRGLCSALLVYAANELAAHAIDKHFIIADENDTARNIYEARGFVAVDRLRGLEFVEA